MAAGREVANNKGDPFVVKAAEQAAVLVFVY